MIRKDAAQDVGRLLAEFFKRKGLTQAQVAECYGVSQSWVGRVYKGEFGVRAQSVQKMCNDASVSFLTELPEQDQATSSTRLRLTRLLDSVWEGTEEDAKVLTQALLAIKMLRRS
ncbi:TPA: helix-turn-helix transcriptional regulator [Pseudomonas aeruginosa]|jgi:transcriptional regulator with XRE-family HTH domain|nr:MULTISPECIES: helix-turn-helix transcriptional regulator [Pseudomonas]AVZ21767.1 XRE family transcriptional regulator [Pseudomonas aeruginosa]AXC22554.1 XRE family transcriptional regulator [Pseudomonas aeruginosa]AYW43101.1 XRE family transcriptional regulator [Pseudomonas aeruginosa]EIU7097407.1 helix-turn-helix transcriptional regulator [Pseudomonas aeruginosa]EIU7107479.1 helix-turn-helix transcriptional regulator [Pseudomonas aeruginosa]